MKAKLTAKKRVPPILPREPLTKKAKAGIYTYAVHGSKDALFALGVVNRTLAAERMRRVDLYAWLEAQGYRWLAKFGYWEKPKSGVE